ncbi:MAG: glutamate--tRNA ligase [Phycisphaerae bacterium]|jgi:glutamyl-tRNA synthetase
MSSAATPPVVTRFAPSPTGHLHIGGARTALFCWAFARRHGGRFILRIEDTDRARSSIESARGIMEDLAWLGIEWDEGPEFSAGGRTLGGDPRKVGPFFQAQRVHLYDAYIEWLVANELAYPAFDTASELDAQRKAVTDRKGTFRYDRTNAMQVPPAERLDRMRSGTPHVIRLLAPREEIVVKDSVLGDVRYAAGELDDFVLRKADGFPTYHFAVVIDDELMGVTHVLRAQEHLNNTPRHVALQRALRRLDTGEPFRTPAYAHMPLIFNMDSTKMSKRDKAKAARAALKAAMAKDASLTPARIAGETGLDASLVEGFAKADNDSLDAAAKIAARFNAPLPEIEVADFRANGYLPSAIDNFLALLGWNPGMKLPDGKDLEKFDTAFLAANFSLERIGTTNARFDRVKLASFNGDAIAALPVEEFAARWAAWCLEHQPALPTRLGVTGAENLSPRWLWLAQVVRVRAKTLAEASRPASFILLDDGAVPFDRAAVDKHLLASDATGLALLARFADRLAGLDAFEPAPIHALIEEMVKEAQLPNMGPLAQAIRVAVAGVAVSPPLGETLASLGRDSSMKRLRTCLAAFSPAK